MIINKTSTNTNQFEIKHFAIALLCLILFAFMYYERVKVHKLEQKNEELQSSVSSLEDQIQDLSRSIDNLEEENEELQNSVDYLDNRIDWLSRRVGLISFRQQFYPN